MFKQIVLGNTEFVFFRKNQTYRLILSDTGVKTSETFGVEMDVSTTIKIIKEMRRLGRKDLNLRAVEWEINNYQYSFNPVWPNEKSDKVWLSFTSIDSSLKEQDFISSMTFTELNQLIKFIEEVDEL